MKFKDPKAWENLYKQIGPLRYQVSGRDCVPATVINGLILLAKKRIDPKLLRLIWRVSVDYRGGTGYVSSRIISEIITAWSDLAEYDGSVKTYPEKFESKILSDEEVKLESLIKWVKSEGIACISTQNGGHYCLMIAQEESGRFLGFDPWWTKSRTSSIKGSSSIKDCDAYTGEYKDYYGLVNIGWSENDLKKLLKLEENQWVHLIRPLPSKTNE